MDLAPLVDVMFILVIFFLIRTSYDFQTGYKVDLPEGKAPIVAGNKMVVVLATNGEGLDVTKPENIIYLFKVFFKPQKSIQANSVSVSECPFQTLEL